MRLEKFELLSIEESKILFSGGSITCNIVRSIWGKEKKSFD